MHHKNRFVGENQGEEAFWHRSLADHYEIISSNFAQSELYVIRYKADSLSLQAWGKWCLNLT